MWQATHHPLGQFHASRRLMEIQVKGFSPKNSIFNPLFLPKTLYTL
jgi:hypothetical protein